MSCLCCCWGTWLVPNDPSRAVSSRFLSTAAFRCYRFIVAIYFVFWCVFWPVAEDIRDGYQFVTHWTFYVAALYAVVSFLTACGILRSASPLRASDGPQREVSIGEETPLSASGRFVLWLQIFSWNIGCVSSLVVVTIFWGVLYQGGSLDSVDINAHIMIAIVMVIDQLLVATEFQFKQLLASELLGVLYVAFSITFYFTGPKDDRLIYDIMDWGEDPEMAALYSLGILFVLMPLFAGVHLGIYSLRELIYTSCSFKYAASSPDAVVQMEQGGTGYR